MEVCCSAGAPVSVEYTPQGSVKELGGVQCYVTGSEAAQTAIVGIYDIFGFTSQFKQVCDRLAAAGYLVVGPDVFRGQPWTLDKFPPKPEDNFLGWLQGYSWEAVVSKDVTAVVSALQAQGVTKFASVGWCWGASMAVQAAAADPGSFKATAFLHPSMFGQEKQLVEKLQCPLASFSTPGDPLEAMQEVTDAKPWGPACVYRRVDNMTHGYCGARGDFANPEVVKAVSETLTTLVGFLDKQLK